MILFQLPDKRAPADTMNGCRICTVRKCLCLREQEDFLRCHGNIGQKNRIAGDIIPAEVQKPGNIVKGSQHMVICPVAFHRLSQIRNLVRPRLPRPLCI